MLPIVNGFEDVNLQDYIDMVIDYLCLHQWAEVEISEVQTKQNKNANSKKKEVILNGISYFVFDSRWFTEICNNNEFIISGHFRLQPYGDGSRRLIWINEFKKHGYHRRVLIEQAEEGQEFI